MGLSAAFEVHRYSPSTFASIFDEPQNEVAIPGSRRKLSSDRAARHRVRIRATRWREPAGCAPMTCRLLRRRNAAELRRLPFEQPAIDSARAGGERGVGALLDDLAAIEHQNAVE